MVLSVPISLRLDNGLLPRGRKLASRPGIQLQRHDWSSVFKELIEGFWDLEIVLKVV